MEPDAADDGKNADGLEDVGGEALRAAGGLELAVDFDKAVFGGFQIALVYLFLAVAIDFRVEIGLGGHELGSLFSAPSIAPVGTTLVH